MTFFFALHGWLTGAIVQEDKGSNYNYYLVLPQSDALVEDGVAMAALYSC
ncbi:hypothetical protein ACXM0N_28080 [Peribacillus simplex]